MSEKHKLQVEVKRNEHRQNNHKHNNHNKTSNRNKSLGNLDKSNVINSPIAHHDGNFFIDEAGLRELYANDQVLLHYCDKDGEISNPNGSVDSIAGICNKEKNVFGLMSHPERAMEDVLGSSDGIKMLEGLM